MIAILTEFLSAFVFVLLGVGTTALVGSSVGALGVAFGFGVAMFASLTLYGNRAVTGNPALTTALLVSRRLPFKSFILRIIGQFIGAFAGVYAVKLLADSTALGGSEVTGLAQNGYFMLSSIRMSMIAVIAIEVVLTVFLAMSYINSIKREENQVTTALIQAVLFFGFYLLLIPIDGGGLNPARSLASNVIFGGEYLSQSWLFVSAPFVGAIIAGLLTATKRQKPTKDDEEDEDDEDE